MYCDLCDYAVVEYSHSFLDAEFHPCLVLVGWLDTEGCTTAIQAYRSRRWHELVHVEHREYLDSLIQDWTAADGEGREIREYIDQLRHAAVGPIRTGDCGKTDRDGLASLLEKVLGISAAV